MKLTSKNVYLRSLEAEDCNEFYHWSQDREVTQYSLSAYAYPQSKSKITQWLSNINDTNKTVTFGICCTKTEQLIGYTGIASISALNRCGEYFILIGDKTYWGKGIGTDVTKLITNYGFETLGLHRIELTAFSNNSAASNAYKRAGYTHEGTMRQAGYRNGQFIDKVMMSVLSSDWKKL